MKFPGSVYVGQSEDHFPSSLQPPTHQKDIFSPFPNIYLYSSHTLLLFLPFCINCILLTFPSMFPFSSFSFKFPPSLIFSLNVPPPPCYCVCGGGGGWGVGFSSTCPYLPYQALWLCTLSTAVVSEYYVSRHRQYHFRIFPNNSVLYRAELEANLEYIH